ncbi:trace amine-associated receptor 1-like [Symphorus nematophorus]
MIRKPCDDEQLPSQRENRLRRADLLCTLAPPSSSGATCFSDDPPRLSQDGKQEQRKPSSLVSFLLDLAREPESSQTAIPALELPSFATTYLLYIVTDSLSFLIICGNLLVITSIIYFKQLHTPTNFLILSLAVADVVVGVLLLPFSMMPVTFNTCRIMASLDLYLCACSVWNLCFISVDRYYAVCQPLRYRSKINVHVSVIMILLSWTISALSSAILGLQDIFCFYLPAIIMSIIYLKILMVAQRQARSIQNTTCQRTKSESKMERKATKTLAIVMGVFLICWTPYFLCWTSELTINYRMSFTMGFALRWLGWLNSMLNPFIYAFFYSWFRSAFRMIISGKIFQGDFSNS